MSWFYIGKKSGNDAHMTYQVVHQFNQAQEVGNPLTGQPTRIEILPAMTVDLVTDNVDAARARVNYLNGGKDA